MMNANALSLVNLLLEGVNQTLHPCNLLTRIKS